MRIQMLLPLLALVLGTAARPVPAALNDPKTTEGWIWQQVQAGVPADLNSRCGTAVLDVAQTADIRWQDECRRVHAPLLQALLTRPDLGDGGPLSVIIRGAYIEGALDLEGAHIKASQIGLQNCRLTGDLQLEDAKLDGVLDLTGSSIDQRFIGDYATISGRLMLIDAEVKGGITANAMHVGSFLFLRGTRIGDAVVLRDARIDDQIDMEGAVIADGKPLDAERLSVGHGGLYMQKVTFGGPVDIMGARIDGDLLMNGASVAPGQPFNAQSLKLGAGNLFMTDAAFGGPVVLRDADVHGQINLRGASVAAGQSVDANRLRVAGGGLLLTKTQFGGQLDLISARVEGQLDLSEATFPANSSLNAELLQVGEALLARNATFGREVDLQGISVGNLLDLRGAHIRVLLLQEADIKADLVLGGRRLNKESWALWNTCDPGVSCLDLRNARVGNLQDDERAWPARISLEGFKYAHLGGEQRQDMRRRPIGWWRGWLARDPVYSTQPYTQLADVLAAAGNRDGAADIRFFGRDRERLELLRGCHWLQGVGLVEKPDDDRSCGIGRWGTWIGLTTLQVFAGYGIGAYGFRAIAWA